MYSGPSYGGGVVGVAGGAGEPRVCGKSRQQNKTLLKQANKQTNMKKKTKEIMLKMPQDVYHGGGGDADDKVLWGTDVWLPHLTLA